MAPFLQYWKAARCGLYLPRCRHQALIMKVSENCEVITKAGPHTSLSSPGVAALRHTDSIGRLGNCNLSKNELNAHASVGEKRPIQRWFHYCVVDEATGPSTIPFHYPSGFLRLKRPRSSAKEHLPTTTFRCWRKRWIPVPLNH